MPNSKPNDKFLAEAAGVTVSGAATGEAMPTEEPPSTLQASGGAGAAGAAVTVWVNSQKVNALWTISENRNSWIGVAGVGWRKLANNSDSAVVALAILGAHAKQTQGQINYRQEADNMIHEIYAW